MKTIFHEWTNNPKASNKDELLSMHITGYIPPRLRNLAVTSNVESNFVLPQTPLNVDWEFTKKLIMSELTPEQYNTIIDSYERYKNQLDPEWCKELFMNNNFRKMALITEPD